MRQLFKGATVISCADQSQNSPADMRVHDGRIVEIGPELAADGDEVQDLSGRWVLSGFVQSHVHLCQTLFRGMAEDRVLLDWLGERIWPLEAAHDEESTYWSARLGIAEMLLCGTTAFLDMGSLRHTSSTFLACEEAGVRATSGRSLMDRENPAGLHASHEENLRGACDEADRWHNKGRLRYGFAPRFVPSCSEGLLRETLSEARRRKAVIHTHASENVAEIQLVRELTGKDNIVYFGQIGMLGPDVALAHCIHLSDPEMQLLAETRTRVLHCPSSNMKLASGIAPIPELLARGVHISVGADGAPCNNRLDPFSEMRKVGLLQALRLGPGHLDPSTILQMMT
ncbi:MAG: amidohydrolase family protein, partial [Myxococcota bacterium]|nr:amidohydrolase family protein [Myxococcota bacterium]